LEKNVLNESGAEYKKSPENVEKEIIETQISGSSQENRQNMV